MRMPQVRFSVRRMMIVVAVAGLLSFWLNHVIVRPVLIQIAGQRWHRRVKADYEILARSRPPEISRGQWEFLVCWTNNLHANYGSPHGIRDIRRADRFADELERRLGQPVSAKTIDWIWDEYMEFTRGQTYDRYRPTRSPDLATAQPGCFGSPVP